MVCDHSIAAVGGRGKAIRMTLLLSRRGVSCAGGLKPTVSIQNALKRVHRSSNVLQRVWATSSGLKPAAASRHQQNMVCFYYAMRHFNKFDIRHQKQEQIDDD